MDNESEGQALRPLAGRIGRRSVLRAAVMGVAGAAFAIMVGVDPAGLRSAAAGEARPARSCRPCGASVNTRAGYVVCDACQGATCPRCARASGENFLCSICEGRT